MTEQTIEEMRTELETLRTLKADLHKNLTEARARLKGLEQTVEQQQAELVDVKLNRPVAAMLDGVLYGKYAPLELAEHYKFELGDDGIELRDLEGNPATIVEKVDGKEVSRPVRFEQQDIHRFLSSTGKLDHIIKSSGATGGSAPNNSPSGIKQPEAKPVERKSSSFGLK